MIPLSTRMKPKTLDEFYGQDFVKQGTALYNSIINDSFRSAIFFGPSGSGKTSLARIISTSTNKRFIEVNGATSGIKDIKELIISSKGSGFEIKEDICLYVDEIHRWNKLQQDVLLKSLEDGGITLIGSTTENPYFSVNPAILSRVTNVYEFKPLSSKNIQSILKNALKDKERGLGLRNVNIDNDSINLVAEMSLGDARFALDSLEFLVDTTEGGIDIEIVKKVFSHRRKSFSKSEDKYNLLSAFQKSIRGSDVDASLLYLAQLIKLTGDIDLIGRRLLVIASEDIGMANPDAINVVYSCVKASQMVGLPEARINLAQAVVFLAASPKSNSVYMGINKAIEDANKIKFSNMPNHIKDFHYEGAKKRGAGEGYLYPHSYGGYVKQQYLPNDFHNLVKYYEPTENGLEKKIKNFLESLEDIK